MTREELFQLTCSEYDIQMYSLAKEQWNHISKPLDGLGDYEEVVCQLAAIQKKLQPEIEKRVLVVFCSDNGIVSHGVTQSEQDITQKVALALGLHRSTANCMAQCVKADVLPVDIGIACSDKLEGVLDDKIAMGTRDFLLEPAMTEEEVLAAIAVGYRIVREQGEKGTTLLATGEMGIGNTTTTAAVLAALLRKDSDTIVGRGAGLNDEKLRAKKEVVRNGVQKYQKLFDSFEDEQNRSFEILRCLGGYDLAALCGVFLGGARFRMPIIIDGVISATAALLAERILPGAKWYMIASHSGREKGTRLVLEALGKEAFINGNMALGEGTGALMLLPLLDTALYLYTNGSRFEENGIKEYERFDK